MERRFFQRLFGAFIGCMGASKRCFGVRGCLGTHLESLEAIWKHLEQIEKKFEIDFSSCFCTLRTERNGIVSACIDDRGCKQVPPKGHPSNDFKNASKKTKKYFEIYR